MADPNPWADLSAVLAHGAGSGSRFLQRAFPADRLGMAHVRCLDDRTGNVARVARMLRAACPDDRHVIVGGVSLGAHAAAGLLASRHRPAQVRAGLLVMPAWTGPPDVVADLTATAADAVASLGPEGVLADLDPSDWVTAELADAWAWRDPGELSAELREAARQPAPTKSDLAAIDVPVAVVALAGDPLHPESVARRWAELIPAAGVAVLGRDEPASDRAVFADAACDALADAFAAAG